MAVKKLGELLKEYGFDAIHNELINELKTDIQIISLCKVLYDGLKNIEYTPTKLKYAIITNDAAEGHKEDQVVAYADFLENTISIHDLEPGEIVSTEVDLDDPELEVLFVALCLSTLSQETEDDEDEDDLDVEINYTMPEPDEIGEKEYSEDSLFPFKKTTIQNEQSS